jgi:hypothetical protein
MMSDASNNKKWSIEEMMMLYHLKIGKKSHKEIAEIMTDKLNKREYNENLIHKKWQSTDWVDFLQKQGEKELLIKEINDKDYEKNKIIETTLEQQEKLVKIENARTELIIDSIKSAIYRLPKPKAEDLKYKKPDNKIQKG